MQRTGAAKVNKYFFKKLLRILELRMTINIVSIFRIISMSSVTASVVKNLPVNEGDMGLIPGLGRSHM